jgi:tetratricopeptide (TPR) repeat protein
VSETTSLLVEAFALHQAGRLAEAEQTYNRILAIQPDHFDSLHLLGIVFHQRGEHAQALRHIDLALEINPNNIPALNSRGIALRELKRFEDALASYDRALKLLPDYAEALFGRGNALKELRRFEEALASYDRAVAVRPDYVQAHANRGDILNGLERFEEALASYDRAVAIHPDFADAHANRANVLHALKRFDEAMASHDRALALRPDLAEAHTNRGSTLHELMWFDEALESHDRALALRPDYTEAHYNRGNALHKLKRFAEALASYERALALRPDFVEALANRGVALHSLNRFEEALASYDRALAVRPGYAKAFVDQGDSLCELRRFEEALASYDRAIELRPDYAEAHGHEAMWRMLIGDFERGWQKLDWAWIAVRQRNAKRSFSQPQLFGSHELEGKTVLLHAEQGFGDMIQFCRYVPLVAERGARVILEVYEPLRALMSTLPGVAQIVTAATPPGVAQTVTTGEPLPDFDLHCPLLSLPLALGAGSATILSQTPYLRAAPQAVMDWNDRLGPRRRPRIGLAWSGRPSHDNDHNRSIRLSSFLPLLAGFDATYVSLLQDVREEDAPVLQGSDVVHFGKELTTYADTAALIANLDLVISVDTSVAHLAGALAKPLWLLLPFTPDWRWLLDRDDSPWYPTARLFRQDETRRWDSVMARVQAALDDDFRSL